MQLTRVQIHQTVLIILLFALFPKVIKTWFNRFPKGVYQLVSGKISPSHYLIKGSGLNVLPREVQIIRSKVLDLDLESFKFSNGMKAQETYYQRLCESLYPVLPSVNSKYVIATKNEPLLNCKEVVTSKEMKIVHCP